MNTLKLISPALAKHWQGKDPFTELAQMDGEVYRELAGRRTFRFQLEGQSYFAKLHFGVGWAEILKNLLQLRLPILGADNEWRAIGRLQKLGIDTMTLAGHGSRGSNPARRESFVITEELVDTVSLEDYCRPWPEQPPAFTEKHQLIRQLAEIARTLHDGGVCHRDFYLCHFHRAVEDTDAGGRPRLYLIDLHRALIKSHLPQRWIVKDIAGLYYSAMHIGLTLRDRLRFIRYYDPAGLRQALDQRRDFWEAVDRRARAMYKKLGPAS